MERERGVRREEEGGSEEKGWGRKCKVGRGKGRSMDPDREKRRHSVLVTKSERTDGPSLFYYIFRVFLAA